MAMRPVRRLAQMSTRVIIKFMPNVQDEMGGSSPKLTTYASRWAKVEPMGGRSAMQGPVLQSSVTHKVTMRFDPAIKAAWVIELPAQEGSEGIGPQLRIETLDNPDLAGVYTVAICTTYRDRTGGK